MLAQPAGVETPPAGADCRILPRFWTDQAATAVMARPGAVTTPVENNPPNAPLTFTVTERLRLQPRGSSRARVWGGRRLRVAKAFSASNDSDFEAKKNGVLELYDIANRKGQT